jgi:hypothetical protein
MEEKVWVKFFEQSKKPFTCPNEFATYCKEFSAYTFQSPHVQDCLKFSKNTDEFLKRLKEFGELA